MPFDIRPGSADIRACNRTAPNCLMCPASANCLVGDAGHDSMLRWNSILQVQMSVAQGASIFDLGDVASAVFTVRAGCIKTFTVDHDGHERVRGFHLPGDIVGLDALGGERHVAHAIAVMPSQICRVPRAALLKLLAETPSLMLRLVERLSSNLGSALTLAGDYSADQRVAAFLLSMQERLNPLPGAAAKLPMGRRDIANYLRMATETVCRVLTRFEQQGLIKTQERVFRVLNPAALYVLAEPVGICPSPEPLQMAA